MKQKIFIKFYIHFFLVLTPHHHFFSIIMIHFYSTGSIFLKLSVLFLIFTSYHICFPRPIWNPKKWNAQTDLVWHRSELQQGLAWELEADPCTRTIKTCSSILDYRVCLCNACWKLGSLTSPALIQTIHYSTDRWHHCIKE